jgi:hypothetical protein
MTKPIGEAPSNPIKREDHMSIRALLPEYVSMQILGQEPPLSWRPLENHLAHCSACRQEAEALLRLMNIAYEEESRPLLHPPLPDLSFLHPLHVPARPHHPARSRPRPVHIQFTPAMLPSLRVMMIARSGIERLQYAYHLPPQAPDDPDISIEVFTHDERAEHGLVRITVELPDSDPFDQAGSAVALTAAGIQFGATTDQNGVVSWSDVPLDRIAFWRISVTPGAASS